MTAAIPSLAAMVPRAQVAAVVTKPFEIATMLRLADDAVRGNHASGSSAVAPAGRS